MIRNKRILKVIGIFLLINFLQSVFLPSVVLAVTSGSSQPEFTSYEPGVSTDMVNLMTGDFSYNIPILNLPGPEGNFQLPLSYHAGIGPEQEASWVGLGWNINPGAISRGLNQYPDDAKGEHLLPRDLLSVHNSGTGPTFWEDNYFLYHRN